MLEIKKYTQNPNKEIIEAALRIHPKVVIKDSEDEARLIQLCLRQEETSILVHANAQIELSCSLCVAYELLCNDLDITFKTNLVNGHDLSYITPKEISNDDQLKSFFIKYIKKINTMINELRNFKKPVNYRYIVPGCIKVDVLFTANFSELIKIIRLERLAKTSNELKEICNILYIEFSKICPNVFNKTNLKFKL